MNESKRKEDDKCVTGECTCMMDRFMLYNRTEDSTEAAVAYLGNSYLVRYNPGVDSGGDACAAIVKAFIDGAYWHAKRTQPRKGRIDA